MNQMTVTGQDASSAVNVRAMMIAELQIDHLSPDEQDTIINALGEMLLERATYAVMSMVPDSEYALLDTYAEQGDDTSLQAHISKFVPNVEQVVASAVRDGIAEHKRLVAEEVAKQSI